eukprot:Skav207247  [mRNA]  locus=scaffold523:668809:674034:- [translate_table: standard]
MRVGEAAVPGPGEPTKTWHLGTINPTGLASKGKLTDDLPPGIFAVSETHLSDRGLPRFKAELKASGSKFKYYPGSPAPLQSCSPFAVAGVQTGVGFLSSLPTRPICFGWDPELYASGRIHAATFLVGQQWIGGAVIYGQSSNHPNSVATKEATNSLLEEITRQLVTPFPGPTFIAGDWNQEHGALPEANKWIQQGWQDIQSWAEEKLGIKPGPTCKYVSRKDFMYISPTMQQWITKVYNEFDMFPDHSTLYATMVTPGRPDSVPRWPKPKAIDYSKVTPKMIASWEPEHEDMSTPTEHYLQVCQAFEHHVTKVRVAKGESPLMGIQKGRGATLQREVTVPNRTMVKSGRRGDPNPSSCDWSLIMKQWFTQYRRLCCFVNAFKGNAQCPRNQAYRLTVWNAVMRAKGFRPSFLQWWHQMSQEHPGWPTPQRSMPKHDVAKDLRDQLKQQVDTLHKLLNQQNCQRAKQARQEDPNMVFRDVRRPAPEPVSMLVARCQSQVLEVHDEASVIIEDSSHFHPDRPVETSQGSLPVIHVEEHQIWFAVPHGLQQGDIVAQVEPKGSVHDIHAEFIQEWLKRWDRHRNLESDHWQEIVRFVELSTPSPPRPMELSRITVDRWKRTLQSKKRTAAAGMDAMTRADLLAMPDWCHQELLKIFEHAEQTGEWPQQLLTGAVHSLAKVPGAETAKQFRPITVMPIAYRTWSSMRAKEVLTHIAQVAPSTMYCKPGSDASALWWGLQQRLETHMYMGEADTGIVTDVVKAFNHLPREPVFMAAKCLGVHPGILRAWKGATCGLSRCFFVQNSPSVPVGSCTGYVEGCGMSVAAMALTNHVIHQYMQLGSPQACFSTYVDNFELTARTVEGANQAFQKLEGICKLLDLSLDYGKTYRWATTAHGRSELRELSHAPTYACRDLGGHMQYCARQGNATVTERIESLKDFWPKLARSRASAAQKLKTLRTSAWPRALHGSSIVHVGASHFTHLRTQAMRSLGWDKAGANPQIQFSLFEPTVTDPEFVVLQDSVTQFRRHATEAIASWTLAQAEPLDVRQRKPGPIGVLLTRLQNVGWMYHGGTTFLDEESLPIDILLTACQEVKHRLRRAWCRNVGMRWATRKGFEAFARVSYALSKPVDSMSHEAHGLLRAVMNGTQFTADAQSHFSEATTKSCIFCGQAEDSMYHRHWECSKFAESRSQIPESIRGKLMTQPLCTLTRGWLLEPPSGVQFRQMLHAIPDTTAAFEKVVVNPSQIDLFVDGTGLSPTTPEARLVAWAVVLAGVTVNEAQVVSQGGVPGQWQTVARAELTAFVSALLFATQQSIPTRIWCDNQGVVTKARGVQQGRIKVGPNMNDHDLWTQVQDLFASAPDVEIVGIRSHQAWEDEVEWKQWAFQHNNLVDRQAARALQQLPVELLRVQRQVEAECKEAVQMKQALHEHFVRVGLQAIQTKPESSEPEVRSPAAPEDSSEVINLREVAEVAADQMPAGHRFRGVDKVLSWLQHVTDDAEPPIFVSWYELLFDFQIHTGLWGVESRNGHNTWGLTPHTGVYDVQTACRWFTMFLTKLIRLKFPQFRSLHGRPYSHKFQVWMMGGRFRLSASSKASVAQWLHAQLGDSMIHGVQQAFAHFPPASLEVTRVPATERTFGLHRFFV